MEIRQYGQNSVWIKGKKEVIWLNPSEKLLKEKGSEGRIIIFWSVEANFLGRDSGERVAIYGPGEYEVGGVEINGIRIGDEGESAFIISIDGIKIGYLSDAKVELTDKKKEKLSECDVLITEGGEIEPKEVLAKAKLLGVSYLITTKANDEYLKKLLDLADAEGKEKIEGLKIDKENLPEATEVVLLTEM
jgi:L-ascorbate metabolism protein UlaG (beta-lactamase superfamily)